MTVLFVYFVFVLFSVIIYYSVPKRFQSDVLLVSSSFFYGLWEPRFIGLLLISIGTDYYCASRMYHSTDQKSRRKWLAFSVMGNIGLLGFFKYANFFVSSVDAALSLFWPSAHLPLVHCLAPMGISFMMFRKIGYCVDIYRDKTMAPLSLKEFSLFVMFIPQIISGPIERAKDLAPQIVAGHRLAGQDVLSGCRMIFWGFFKKFVIGDNLGQIVNATYDAGASASGLSYMIATLAFAVQIYADFSGYTDIAIGTAQYYGIRSTKNFDAPYFSTSPSDFWRRWHISLSLWFRDYVYIPMGGSRAPILRQLANLFITMLLCGLWHGPSWTFVIWGVYHGILLCAHRVVVAIKKGRKLGNGSLLRRSFDITVTFQLVCFGWIFFRSESVDQALQVVTALAGISLHDFVESKAILGLVFYGSCLFLVEGFELLRRSKWSLTFCDDHMMPAIPTLKTVGKAAVYAGATYLICFHGVEPQTFIYARF